MHDAFPLAFFQLSIRINYSKWIIFERAFVFSSIDALLNFRSCQLFRYHICHCDILGHNKWGANIVCNSLEYIWGTITAIFIFTLITFINIIPVCGWDMRSWFSLFSYSMTHADKRFWYQNGPGLIYKRSRVPSNEVLLRVTKRDLTHEE